MSDKIPLRERRCIPCQGDIRPLSSDEIASLSLQISNWELDSNSAAGNDSLFLRRELRFKNFREAMAFLRELEEIAEAEGHHPDFCVHYNRVRFTLWTHAIAGLHENDFVLAAKIDQLYERYYSIKR